MQHLPNVGDASQDEECRHLWFNILEKNGRLRNLADEQRVQTDPDIYTSHVCHPASAVMDNSRLILPSEKDN